MVPHRTVAGPLRVIEAIDQTRPRSVSRMTAMRLVPGVG
jgi:hypothetical protein